MPVAKKTTEEKVVKSVKPVKTAVKKVSSVAKAMDDKEATVKVETPEKKVSKKAYKSVSFDVYGVDGKVTGKVSVPGEMFGDKVNKTLLAQAVRVYMANQRQGNASTKTRGEVDGSTRKIYKQKGTGKARHGSIRAPIFVKGGIVFGPRPRDFGLSLPTKMKRKALFSALSAKVLAKEITIVDGFETLEAKTKVFVGVLDKLGFTDKKRKVLLVTDTKSEKVKRAGSNVPGILFAGANRLNAYEILRSKRIIIMKDALSEMEKTFLGK